MSDPSTSPISSDDPGDQESDGTLPGRSRDELLLGAGIAWLWLFSERWIDRRVQAVRFLDAQTLNIQVSSDFTPPRVGVVEDMLAVRPVVPLAMLRKRKLAKFSIWNAEHRRLPMLTRADNGRLSGLALLALAGSEAQRKGLGPIPVALQERFMAIPAAPAEGGDRRPRGIDLLYQLQTGQGEDGVLGEELLASPQLLSFARDLAESFVLYVEPREGGDRELVKFEFEQVQKHELADALSRESRWERVAGSARAAAFEVGTWMAWLPARYEIETYPIGESASYHLEVEAPPELYAERGELVATGTDGAVEVDPDPKSLRRVHMYLAGVDRDAAAIGRVTFRTRRLGLIVGALVLQAAIAALLGFGKDQVETLLDTNPAELLLLLPTLVAAYVAKPHEHEIATRSVRGPRLLLLGSAGCSFAAAAYLHLGGSVGEISNAWCILFWASIVLAGLQLLSLGTGLAAWIAKQLKIQRSLGD